MLLDHLSNANQYYSTNPYLAKALKWLEANAPNLSNMENGEYEIDGRDVYAIVNSYDTKAQADCGWEAHLKYCDIHYSVSGSERIGYSHISQMTLKQAHDSEKDYALYDGEGDFLVVKEGMFCYAPGCMSADQSTFLKKVVIKLLA
jgi:YhcH/YjgK/YiaL family protein